MEWVGKEAYGERLNQRGRNTEHRGESAVETGDRSDLHLEADRMTDLKDIILFAIVELCISIIM